MDAGQKLAELEQRVKALEERPDLATVVSALKESHKSALHSLADTTTELKTLHDFVAEELEKLGERISRCEAEGANLHSYILDLTGRLNAKETPASEPPAAIPGAEAAGAQS